jgi:hypothetical protein
MVLGCYMALSPDEDDLLRVVAVSDIVPPASLRNNRRDSESRHGTP